MGVQYLLPTHHQREFTFSVTVGAIVNIILNIPMIKVWGLYGAMWATVISEIAVMIYQLWAVRKLLSYKALFASSWKYFISSFIMFCLVFWMNQTMKDSWLMMGLEIFVGILIYIILIWMLRAPIIEQATDLIKKKLINKE